MFLAQFRNWMLPWGLIRYGSKSRDKLLLLIICSLRVLLVPLCILSRPIYRRVINKCSHSFPKVFIDAPYGRYYIPLTSWELVMLAPFFEKKIISFILSRAKNMFIDVGSNIGRHAITVAKLRPDCSVLAIEPSKETYDMLIKNTKLNYLANLRTIRCACAERKGKAFFRSFGKFEHVFNKIEFKRGKRLNVNTVETNKLDNILREYRIPFGKVDIVKIDVEGSEDKVLKGASALLKNGKAMIVFEAWDINKFENCQKILKKYDYICRPIDFENYVAEKCTNSKI